MNILERYASMDYGPAPEARAEADIWLKTQQPLAKLFINGEFVAPRRKDGGGLDGVSRMRVLTSVDVAPAWWLVGA